MQNTSVVVVYTSSLIADISQLKIYTSEINHIIGNWLKALRNSSASKNWFMWIKIAFGIDIEMHNRLISYW